VDTFSPKDRISVRASLWAAGLYGLALLLIYRETAMSMIQIWSRSDTFAHGFLILPISIWLIWTRREFLAPVKPSPSGWVALLLVVPGLAWLLAWLVDVAVVQQLALVALLTGGAWAILGHRLAGVLAFPLFFLFFAVPMGEGLIAPMMEFTASSTVWLIQKTGIPVYREGLNFALPSGSWSVVEACSGVRYIIASVTVGVLYAYLTYRSWTRRLVFVAVSAIVPVFANTARAYIIVMLGHLSDMTIATGVDHLVYGWVFFGVVIFVLFWLGSFFREDQMAPAAEIASHATPEGASASSSYGRLVATVIVTLLVASAPLMVAHSVQEESSAGLRLASPLLEPEGGWRRISIPDRRWSPPSRVSGQLTETYERDGYPLMLIVQYEDGTIPNADVVGSSSVFARYDNGWVVLRIAKAALQARVGELLVDEAHTRGGGSEILAWSWYLIGDLATSNDYRAKLQQTMARLGYGERGAYRIVLATPVYPSADQARARLRDFALANSSLVHDALRRSAANQN